MKIPNIRASYLKFYQLNPQKIRQTEIIKTNRVLNVSAVKRTPYQQRKEEFLKLKNLIDVKKTLAIIQHEKLDLNLDNLVKKISLNSEIKNNEKQPLRTEKFNTSVKNTSNSFFSIIFKNGPNKRNISITRDSTSKSVCLDVKNFKNGQLTREKTINLPEIKTKKN